MLATLIIVFREVIEAGLIIGIVLSATRGVVGRGRWVSGGVVAGVLGACMVASFASAISSALQGVGQEVFNISILLFAVGMLTWHNVWMARHGREISAHMRDVGADVVSGKRSLFALSMVVGIAVLREGSELVLFLYGIVVSGHDGVIPMVSGALAGLLLGAALAAVMYLGLVRVPMRRLFAVTSWMIALLAAGMAAQAVALLEQAQLLTMLSGVLWNSSAIVDGDSILGKVLHTLIGYTDRPTGMQVLVYVLTVTGIFTLMRLFGHAPKVAPLAASPGALAP